MSNDHEKLKQEEAEKSSRLQELMYVKSHKNSKFTNDMINTKLATPKKKNNKNNSSSIKSDEKLIDHICDYYDELQYNYEYFNNKNSADCVKLATESGDDNKSTCNNSNNNFNNLNQLYQLTKLRKDILNRKLIDHREKLKCVKLKQSNEKNSVTSISSIVDSLTIPTFHFHLILSLTMVLLTHQCPQYLLVL